MLWHLTAAKVNLIKRNFWESSKEHQRNEKEIFYNFITFCSNLRASRQFECTTIEPNAVRKVVVHRLQNEPRRESVKIKYKLHSTKLHNKFNCNEKFFKRKRERLNERRLWRWEWCWYRGRWDALLKLNEELVHVKEWINLLCNITSTSIYIQT